MAENRQSTEVANDGSDVMSQSIGPLSLKPNSAILKNIATASATYQAVVTWDAKDDEAWSVVAICVDKKCCLFIFRLGIS